MNSNHGPLCNPSSVQLVIQKIQNFRLIRYSLSWPRSIEEIAQMSGLKKSTAFSLRFSKNSRFQTDENLPMRSPPVTVESSCRGCLNY